jgi:hypothetical protein
VLVAHPFLLFDSSDLFHGAARWNDGDSFTSGQRAKDRQSVEIRFRCRCDPTACDHCQLSPISHAYREGLIGRDRHRTGGEAYPSSVRLN